MDRAEIADGDLLTEFDSGIYLYRDDLSLRSSVDIAKFRYFEILHFNVKPGHTKEWEEMVKMYHDGYEKAVPQAQWATFEGDIWSEQRRHIPCLHSYEVAGRDGRTRV